MAVAATQAVISPREPLEARCRSRLPVLWAIHRRPSRGMKSNERTLTEIFDRVDALKLTGRRRTGRERRHPALDRSAGSYAPNCAGTELRIVPGHRMVGDGAAWLSRHRTRHGR
jgi:hypothetical protein